MGELGEYIVVVAQADTSELDKFKFKTHRVIVVVEAFWAQRD